MDYYENGQLEEKINYKEDQLHGLWEGYEDDGQLKYKGNFKDGEQISQ